ncbi:MAG: histidine phosphatase family protein [Tissierella sp.]|uniref:histidine phosphatase family protein n=1 Tax=Tissierella sp. TaxID=41274 RepID=UPI003F9CFE57
MKLYIIRHGQTEWNAERRLQGWNNSNLTQKGISDAKRLSKRLEDIDFDHIYSSPQKRAFETANIMKRDRSMDIIKLDGLKEIGFGKWQGMKIEDIEEKYGDEYNTYKNAPHLYKPIEGSESFENMFKRVEDSLRTIIEKGGEEVLIVCHGVTIKILISIIKKIPLEELPNIPIHVGTALNICKVNEEKIEFIVEGDTSHME